MDTGDSLAITLVCKPLSLHVQELGNMSQKGKRGLVGVKAHLRYQQLSFV